MQLQASGIELEGIPVCLKQGRADVEVFIRSCDWCTYWLDMVQWCYSTTRWT